LAGLVRFNGQEVAMSRVIALQRVRRHPRVDCDARVRVVCEGTVAEGSAHDLSIGGIWINGVAVPIGASVEVTLWLPSLGPVQAHGTVRRSTADGIGVQFHLLAANDLVRLHRFVCDGLGMLDAG
jgi:hypothetical protein